MQNSPPMVASSVAVVMGSLYGSIVTYFTNLPDGVFLCALIGATLYVLTNVNMGWKKQTVLFAISFLIGTTEAAQITAEVLTKLLTHIDVDYKVGVAAGALVVSASGVTVLLVLMHFMQAYAEKKLHVDNPYSNNGGDQ